MFKRLREFLNPRNIKLPAQRAAVLTAFIVLIAGLVAAVFLATLVARQAREDYRVSLLQKNSAIQSRLATVITGYGQLLYSGAALHNLKGDITRAEWQTFYHDMRVKTEFPATLGLGYVTYLRPGEVARFEQSVRAEGFTDFTVTPTALRSEYTAITYIEPFNDVNKKAFGFDMFSEPLRNAAMSRARDLGTVAMSAPVKLVQDSNATQQQDDMKGVLAYYPVYQRGSSPQTVDERRDKLVGYVYSVVRPNDILQTYLTAVPQAGSGIDIHISDVTGTEHVMIAESKNGPQTGNDVEVTAQRMTVLDRTWEVVTEGRPAALIGTVLPAAIIAAGGLMSLLVSGLMLRALLKRIKHVELSYEAEVERTKDELLALASHQLRTPASGVKQYIGILTSGIVGELTPAQQQIADKAYQTNERQIDIINQLLYVSKLEAGKIVIRPERSNITQALRKIIEQSLPSAEQKNITIVFNTKQPYYVQGDEQYYPMILDNLISNAIKYSFPDSTIHISVSRKSGMVAVAVKDKGVGISDAEQRQLFKKFNRIENQLSRSEGGSGLGLFLAYQLARAHGGDVTVSSKAGSGSVFTLLMPTRTHVKKAVVDITDYSAEL